MSEKKGRGESKTWGLVPDDLLKKALMHISARNPSMYQHVDQTPNRNRILHDLAVIGARKLFTDWSDQEGLQILVEHEQRLAMKLAIQTGKPLPDAPTQTTQTVAPVSTSESQTSAPTKTEIPPTAPATPIVQTPPKPPEQKKPRRVVELIIGESGHSQERKPKR